jgi:predicted SAM-dependent methyltransferase
LGLEIGPSHNPIAPKKKGFNVHVLDHASASDLRKKYAEHPINLDNIEEVDFVWNGQRLHELIGRTQCYDWIIASHVIEHTPDFVSYLQQCEELLKPDGLLSLVVPDKRYCFDCFSPISSTGQVLDAYAEKRVRPSPGQIFDYVANSAKRKGEIAWTADGEGGADALAHTLGEARDHWADALLSASEYVDIHAWRFTPAAFRLVISDLASLGLTGLEIKSEFDTKGCEFYVTLGKSKATRPEVDRLQALQNRMAESAL